MLHAIGEAGIGRLTAEMEIGLARIADPGFPDVVANYANKFPDGRAAECA